MREHTQLGLDELMIVNPGSPATAGDLRREDAAVNQRQAAAKQAAKPRTGQFFLGDDGTVYQLQAPDDIGLPESAEIAGAVQGTREDYRVGHYFLAADGKLYEVVS